MAAPLFEQTLFEIQNGVAMGLKVEGPVGDGAFTLGVSGLFGKLSEN